MDSKYYTKIGVADEQLEVPFDGTVYARCDNCGKEVKVLVRRGHGLEGELCGGCRALRGLLRAVKARNIFGLVRVEEADATSLRVCNDSGEYFTLTLTAERETPKRQDSPLDDFA